MVEEERVRVWLKWVKTRIEVNAKGSRRYEYRTGTGLFGWKTMNNTLAMLPIKEAPKNTCWKRINNYEGWWERRTNKLNGQNPVTFVGSFQRVVEVNGDGPRESQNKHSSKQAGNNNTFLETRSDIKVSKARDFVPALAISANRHSRWKARDGEITVLITLFKLPVELPKSWLSWLSCWLVDSLTPNLTVIDQSDSYRVSLTAVNVYFWNYQPILWKLILANGSQPLYYYQVLKVSNCLKAWYHELVVPRNRCWP